MDLLLPGPGLFFWNLLAFLIVFFLLRKFAWGPILSSLNSREKGIADSLESAQRMKAEMAQLKNDNEALLAKAREERAQLLKEARETHDKIVNDARENAKTVADKMISDAQAAINAQKMAALTEVKNQVGKLVIEVSEKVLRQKLADNNAQEAHINGLVNEIKLN